MSGCQPVGPGIQLSHCEGGGGIASGEVTVRVQWPIFFHLAAEPVEGCEPLQEQGKVRMLLFNRGQEALRTTYSTRSEELYGTINYILLNGAGK